MKQQANINLFSYWDSVRRGGDGSHRPEAAPSRLRDMLAGTFLLDVDSNQTYPLRVLGSGVERFAANARIGAPFVEWWDPDSRPFLKSVLWAVHDEDMPVVLGVISLADPRSPIRAEVLLLPLAKSSNGKASVLGGLAPVKAANESQTPGRLAIESSRILQPPLPSLTRLEPKLPPPPPTCHGRRAGDRRFRVIEGGLSTNQTTLSRI